VGQIRSICSQMLVSQLKQECRNRHLPIYGLKNQLIDRIVHYETQQRQNTNHNNNNFIDLTSDDSIEDFDDNSSSSSSSSDNSRHTSATCSLCTSASTSNTMNSRQMQLRIDRALTQRLYLIDRTANLDNHTFRVIGSTGNLYTISIGDSVKCDCPDPVQICKHVIFVLCKILRVPSTSPLITQTTFSPEQMIEILSNYIVPQNVMANQRVLNALSSTNDNNNDIRKPIDEDTECPICFELLADESTVWCKLTCGNNFHKDCFTKWSKTCSSNHVSCPLCRSPWSSPAVSSSSSSYTNFAHLT